MYRCRICKAPVEHESDYFCELWRRKYNGNPENNDYNDKFIGYYCEPCLPGIAKFDQNVGTYIVIQCA